MLATGHLAVANVGIWGGIAAANFVRRGELKIACGTWSVREVSAARAALIARDKEEERQEPTASGCTLYHGHRGKWNWLDGPLLLVAGKS